MGENKLKGAFDHMGPDEEARQRMLQNILLAHEASVDEAQASVGDVPQGVSSYNSRGAGEGKAQAPVCDVPQGGHSHNNYEASEGKVQAQARIMRQPQRSIREFSLLRYVLPIAACLVFALAVTPVFSQLTAAFEAATESSSPFSPSTPSSTSGSGGAGSDDTREGHEGGRLTVPSPSVGSAQAPGGNADAAPRPNGVAGTEEHPSSSAKPPWPSSPAGYVPLSLALASCLVALIIAIRGVIAWRQKNQK